MRNIRLRSLMSMGLFAVVIVATACGGGTSSSNNTEPTADIQIYSQKDPGLEDLLKTQITAFEGIHKTITVKIVHYETEQLRSEERRVGKECRSSLAPRL